MAEATDKESKTEEGSEKKVKEALERGNVPISREASMCASFCATLLITVFMLRDGVPEIVTALARFLDNPSGLSLRNGTEATFLLNAVLQSIARFMVPIFVILIVTGLAASGLQNIPRFVLTRIQPELSKLSLKKGWTRIFGQQGQVEFLKNLFKFVAVSIVVAVLLKSEQDAFLSVMVSEPAALPGMILGMCTRLLAAICTATVVLAAVDLVWVRIHWRKELRMSRQELKDEYKQAEGDPLMKAKRRSLQLERSRRKMMAAVPRATLVIANPTHYAIALRYKREEGGAPTVLAKGVDLVALKIREIAEKSDVPVIEDKALARSMYDAVEVDKAISPDFYRPVAELIHFLYSRGRQKAVP